MIKKSSSILKKNHIEPVNHDNLGLPKQIQKSR
jgi:hypothetical protein